MSVEVVVFDVHQTLACWPEGRVTSVEVQELLSRFGVEISYWAFDTARQAVLLLEAPRRRIEGWTDFLAQVFATMRVSVSVDLLTSLTAIYEQRENMTLYPEALDAVDAARAAGKRVCTFTTLPPFSLGSAGRQLLPKIQHYFDCATVGVAKGDRRFYRRITERLGVRPDRILCVGDTPIADVRLPVECGWQAVLLDRDGKLADIRAGQRGTVATLSELGRYYS
ncbi:MAG: HAD family hydrolase [Planctomycetota bacterium]